METNDAQEREELPMDLIENSVAAQKNSKCFYGWIIVIAATLIYAIGAGPVVCFGIFVKPMANEFGWSRGVITGAFGLYILVLGGFGIAGGLLVDRIGPKMVNFGGGILMGLGLFLTSRSNSVGSFYTYFSILVGVGFSFMFVPLQTTIARWFIKKKGLALGIMFSGYGTGGLMLSPLLQSCIDSYGWRTAFVILGVLVLGIILPASLFLKKDPGEMGLVPLGGGKTKLEGAAKNESSEKAGPALQTQDFTVQEAIRTGAFWIYSLAIILMFLGYFMAQVNMVPHVTDRGVPAAAAALGLGIASAFNAFGRLFMGAVSDKIGTKRALGFCLVLGAIMLFWLSTVANPLMMYLFAILFGFAYGGSVPQMPRLVSELFGVKWMGGIMGIATLITSLGPALGPLLGGLIYDRTGSYSIAFTTGGVSILIAFIFIMLLKVPKKAEYIGGSNFSDF